MKPKKYIVIGNWKMNPETAEKAKEIFSKIKRYSKEYKKTELVICPPFSYIGFLKRDKNLFIGAQDVFYENKGAFTGFIGPSNLQSSGVSYVILGHSERRKFGEGDEIVSKKLNNLLNYNLTPIVCIGESERDSSGRHFSFLKEQIEKNLAGVKKNDIKRIILAYEPIWTIGRAFSEAMKPEDVHESSIFIRKVISDIFGVKEAEDLRIVYGGSVDGSNAGKIVNEGGVQGLLVGRESLDPAGFKRILEAISYV